MTAKDGKAKTGWLDRRRDRKREKDQQKAERLAAKQGEQTGGVARRTKGWDN